MPIERGQALQLAVLLLAVPSQYFISKIFFSQESQRSHDIRRIVQGVKGFHEDYLTLDAWKKWCSNIVSSFVDSNSFMSDSDNLMGESPAIEVLQYRDPKGWFAGSTDIRSPRPPQVRYQVGQVVRHRKWGYRGIIIGWDPSAKAPEGWFQAMEPGDREMEDYENQPNYSILVDTRDRPSPQRTYVPQENLEVISLTHVIHPAIDEYFETFDGARYTPRPYLTKMYPYG